jgi:signal peptidase II
MPRARRSVLLVLGFLGLVGCDQATKYTAQDRLAGRPPVQVVPGVLDVRYVENPGVAFNLERALPAAARPVVIGLGLAAGALALALAWRRRAAWTPVTALGVALVAAGAVGNAIDRIARGSVIDFLHVARWPVFNVADVCVCLGAAALVLGTARAAPPARPPA